MKLRRFLKKWTGSRKKRVFLGIVLFFVLAVTAVRFYLHSGSFKKYLFAKADKVLREKYHLSLSVRSLKYSLTRLSATLEGIEVKPVAGETSFLHYASIDKVSINMGISNVFSGKFHIQKLLISRPRISVDQSPAEESFPEPAKVKKPSKKTKIFSLRLDKFDLDNGIIELSDSIHSIQGKFQDISSQIRFSRGDLLHHGFFKAGKSVVFAGQSRILLENFGLEFRFDNEVLNLDSFTINSNIAALHASGWIRDYQKIPQIDLKLSGVLRLDTVGQILDPHSDYHGQIHLFAAVQGSAEEYFLSGQIKGEELAVKNIPVSLLSADLKGNKETFSLSKIKCDIAGGSIEGDVKTFLAMDNKNALFVKWSSIDMSEISGFIPDNAVTISSLTHGSIRADWSRTDLSDIEAEGEIFFNSSESPLKSRERSNILDGQIKFRVSDGKMEILPSLLTLNQDTVSFSGSMDKQQNLKARFSLSIDDLSRTQKHIFLVLRDIQSSFPQGSSSFQAGGSLGISGEIDGPLKNPTAVLDFEIRGLSIARYRVDTIKTEVFLSRERVSVSNLLVKALRGEITGGLDLDLSGETYSVNLSGKRIDLAGLEPQESDPMGIAGMLKFDLEGRGTFDQPIFSFLLAAEDLMASDINLQALEFRVDSDGREIKSSLILPAYETRLNASLGLKKPYVIRGDLSVPGVHIAAQEVSPDVPGLSIELIANAVFTVPLDSIDGLSAVLEIPRLRIGYRDFYLENSRPILFKVGERKIEAAAFHLVGPETEINISGKFPFKHEDQNRILLEAKANLKLLQFFSPDTTFEGIVVFKGELSGNPSRPQVTAAVELKDGILNNALLPYNIHGIKIRAQVIENLFTLHHFSVGIDEGLISAEGSLLLPFLLSGEPQQSLSADLSEKEILVTLSNLDIGKVITLNPTLFQTKPSGLLEGHIRIGGQLTGIEAVEIDGDIQKLQLSLPPLSFAEDSDIRFSLKDGLFNLQKFRVSGGRSFFEMACRLDLVAHDQPEIDASLSAKFDSADLGPFLKNIRTEGVTSLDLTIKGPASDPSVTGTLAVRDGLAQFQDIPVLASNINGDIIFKKSSIILSSLKGDLNGGKINLKGDVQFNKFELDSARLNLDASNIQINYPEGFSGIANASLDVRTEKDRSLNLSGKIDILRAVYKKDFYPGAQILGAVRKRKPKKNVEATPGMDKFKLDIMVSTAEPATIDNNLAQMELSGNLRIAGTALTPLVTGRIANQGFGEIVFGDRRFQVEAARVDFMGKEQIDPHLNILAKTVLTYDYNDLEITLTLTGPVSNLNYSLSSFPPYSQEELALLLATGQGMEDLKVRPISIIGNQLLQFFVSPIASPVTSGIKNLLKAEEVSIEPIHIATEEDPGARFTFKKNITDRATVIYSADVSSTQKQTWIMNYNITRNFIIHSFQKDDGSYGTGFKHEFSLGRAAKKSPGLGKAWKKKSTIKEIKLEGEYKFSREIIRENIHPLKIGAAFAPAFLNKALERITDFYKHSGYLSVDIIPKISYDDNRDVYLTLDINPRNQIFLRYKGDPIPNKIKNTIIDTWNGKMPEEISVREARSLILDFLHNRGYYTVAVDLKKTTGIKKNTYSFSVTRGKKYKIRKFMVSGNFSVSSKTIKKAVKTAPRSSSKGLWSLIYESDKSREAIKSLYESKGFHSPVVGKPSITVDQNNFSLFITLPIDEGNQTRVQSLELKGLQAFSAGELKNDLKLTPGKIYSPSLVSEDRTHLLNMYKTSGYRDAEIFAEVFELPESLDVNLVYTIIEGVQHKIMDIEILGNRRTSDKFILNQLGFKVGDILDMEKIALSQKNLYNTGMFQSVYVHADPIPGKEGEDRLSAEVLEVDLVKLGYGLRYNSEVKLEGFGEMTFNNFLGGGRTSLLHYRQNDLEKNLRLSLQDPYLFGLKVRSLYSFYYNRQILSSFVTDTMGFTFQQQVDIPLNFSLSYLYRFKRIHTYELEPTGPFVWDIRLFLSEVSTYLIRDTRDFIMDPNRGTFLSLSLTYSPEFLWSDLTYIKFFGQFSFYKSILPQVVWASNFRVGLADAFDQVLIPSERFYAGGSNSIRGFERDMVGPVSPYLGPLGGKGLFILNHEIRFPVFKLIKGVVFYDVGNVYSELRDFKFNNLRHAMGLGLRLDTPVGVLRLDYGFNLFPEEEERRGIFFFSLGQSF